MSMLRSTPDEQGFESCGEALLADAGALDSWYAGFGRAIAEGGETQPPGDRDAGARGPVVRCVSQALTTGTGAVPVSALSLLWASQHLDGLWQLGAELVEPADDL